MLAPEGVGCLQTPHFDCEKAKKSPGMKNRLLRRNSLADQGTFGPWLRHKDIDRLGPLPRAKRTEWCAFQCSKTVPIRFFHDSLQAPTSIVRRQKSLRA